MPRVYLMNWLLALFAVIGAPERSSRVSQKASQETCQRAPVSLTATRRALRPNKSALSYGEEGVAHGSGRGVFALPDRQEERVCLALHAARGFGGEKLTLLTFRCDRCGQSEKYLGDEP